MPGRALEVALETADIAASFAWWSRLGFIAATTGDIWSHPYGVLAAPGLNLALHAAPLGGPLLTLVRPDVAALVPLLASRGVEPDEARLGSETFNELRFTDPAGLPVRVIEARTFSPVPQAEDALPGRFEALSWPAADELAVAAFWSRLHVPCESGADWALLRADIGGQAVAWHSPRFSREPLLVFRHPSPAALAPLLVDRGIVATPRRATSGGPTELSIVSPEGQHLHVLA